MRDWATRRRAGGALHCALLCLLFSTPQQPTAAEAIESLSNKNFADVSQDAEFAITEYNFRIVNRLRIGEAIRERGNADFPRHEIILFCNLSLAEKMLQLDNAFIDHCPYRLSISETRAGVRVGASRLPEPAGPAALREMSQQVNALLEKIVAYAAADDPFLLDE